MRFQMPLLIVMLVTTLSCIPRPGLDDLKTAYIKEWKEFYPSRAFASGDRASASKFEDFGQQRIEDWIRYNRLTANTGVMFEGEISEADEANVHLLVRKARLELDFWENQQGHINNPSLYTGLISQAMTHLLLRDRLTPEEKMTAFLARLDGVSILCDQGMVQLAGGRPAEIKGSKANLERTAEFYRNGLPALALAWGGDEETIKTRCAQTADKITALAAYIGDKVNVSRPDTLGYQDYANGLMLYSHPDLTPEKLAADSLQEMVDVYELMEAEANAWWRESNEGEPPVGVLDLALQAMEENRRDNQQDFLEEFTRLTNEAEVFVREKGLATVPENRTLVIALSPPHFAGASVGGVYSSGPFDPDADTLFYLPSVPDDASEEARNGFYRSFNTHFNIMIIAHEMFPGHYQQQKISSRNPHMIRTLFSDPTTVEGWGSFCEILAIEAGWGDGDRLTMLAHLRKRLENATRAYTSVQVHCEDWSKEQLISFAAEKGLLPPQFAANLWNRVLRSPYQITTYYLGFTGFVRLYDQEKKRLGDAFDIKEFSDQIMEAGGIPIQMIKLD